MSEPEEYTLRWRGREVGPFPLPEINRQLDEHEIGIGHEILYQDKWITLEEFLALLPKPAAPKPTQALSSHPAAVAAPPIPVPPPASRERSSPLRFKVSLSPPAPPPARVGPALRPRYRLLFAFLAIMAGFIGLHNFYARQWLTGLLQLLLSVATFLMGFGIIASWLWAMVEAITVHKDGEGIQMI
jgi:hypothetical protein